MNKTQNSEIGELKKKAKVKANHGSKEKMTEETYDYEQHWQSVVATVETITLSEKKKILGPMGAIIEYCEKVTDDETILEEQKQTTMEEALYKVSELIESIYTMSDKAHRQNKVTDREYKADCVYVLNQFYAFFAIIEMQFEVCKGAKTIWLATCNKCIQILEEYATVLNHEEERQWCYTMAKKMESYKRRVEEQYSLPGKLEKLAEVSKEKTTALTSIKNRILSIYHIITNNGN